MDRGLARSGLTALFVVLCKMADYIQALICVLELALPFDA